MVCVLLRTSIFLQLFRAIYRKSTFDPRYYTALLHLVAIAHHIWVYIEVASNYWLPQHESLWSRISKNENPPHWVPQHESLWSRISKNQNPPHWVPQHESLWSRISKNQNPPHWVPIIFQNWIFNNKKTALQ